MTFCNLIGKFTININIDDFIHKIALSKIQSVLCISSLILLIIDLVSLIVRLHIDLGRFLLHILNNSGNIILNCISSNRINI